MWMRTCQECGHKQADTQPTAGTEPTTAYCNRKCKRCKSSGLDYGSTTDFDYVTEWDGCECQCHDEGMWPDPEPVVQPVTTVDAPVYGHEMEMCEGCLNKQHNLKGF